MLLEEVCRSMPNEMLILLRVRIIGLSIWKGLASMSSLVKRELGSLSEPFSA